jgi:hypothetical protein
MCGMSSNHEGIYRVGMMKFEFFGIFWSSNDQNDYFFNSNGQICIKMIKFEFKRTNQETTPRYHPPTLAMGGSAGDTACPGRPIVLLLASASTLAPPSGTALH